MGQFQFQAAKPMYFVALVLLLLVLPAALVAVEALLAAFVVSQLV
jgi:hypothetical protein